MLRDTPQGYRYLHREQRPIRRPVGGAGRRRRRWRRAPTRVRTLAAGVIVDPNISVPLPFAGLSYVDFDLFGTGTQLNAFFGGSLRAARGVGAVARREPLAARRAGRSASPRRTTTARSGRARGLRGEHPAAAGARVGLAAAAADAAGHVRAGYELDYTRLAAAPTRPRRSFVVPADQVVARRCGSRSKGSAAGGPGRRGGTRRGETGWRAWGRPRRTTIRRTPTFSATARPSRRSTPLTSTAGRPGSKRRLMGGHGPRPFQPLLLRDVRQPAARLSVGARPLRPRRAWCAGAVAWSAGGLRQARRFPRHRAGARSRFRQRLSELHRRWARRSKPPAPFGMLTARRVGLRVPRRERRRQRGALTSSG